MAIVHQGKRLASFLGLVLLATAVFAIPATSQAQSRVLDFDRKGPQPGEQLPNLSLRTTKGEVQQLSDAWRGGPALLVTSSLTCPKSRSRWPELKALAEKYDGKLNVVIVYVIEAHPVGSICPYKDVEDITPENERDGILRKQPKTEEERLELVQEFKRLLRIQTPIYVDNQKDEAWKAFGAAPNLALLVDRDGIVIARQGWFEGKATTAAIEAYLPKELPEPAAEQPAVVDAPVLPFDSGRSPFEPSDLPVDDSPEAKARIELQKWLDDNDVYGIHHLIRDRENEKLKALLEKFPATVNVVVPSDRGHPDEATLLMESLLNDNLIAFNLLLGHGADVRQRTSSYESALQVAAQKGNFEATKLLLAKGADPAFPATGKSPLHEAAIGCHRPVVELLLAKGLRHDIYSAIAMGEVEMVRKGLKFDPSRALRPDGAERMPLDYAAANGQLEIAKLLRDHGAPFTEANHVTVPAPLHRAVSQGQVAMVEWLLEAGHSPNTALGHGGEDARWTPALHMAINKKHLEAVNHLIKHRVDLEQRNPFSLTALHAAASAGEAEIVKALLRAGADPHAKQLSYPTPCGSESESKPTYATPLHFAATHGNPATIATLLAAGAKLEAKTARGKTPLMHAVEGLRYRDEAGNAIIENVTALLDAGADLAVRDQHDRTALDIAEGNDTDGDERATKLQQEIVYLLKERGAKNGQNVPQNAPALSEE